MTVNINNTKTETDFTSVEDALDMYRTAWNETNLFPQVPNIVREGDLIIEPGHAKIPQAFPLFSPYS